MISQSVDMVGFSATNFADAAMRISLEGTQASGEGESHTQDANVAEVSYGEPVTGEPEYPDKPSTTRR
jgi:hypothetical protein